MRRHRERRRVVAQSSSAGHRAVPEHPGRRRQRSSASTSTARLPLGPTLLHLACSRAKEAVRRGREGLVRAPARAHRVLHARRGRAARRAVRAHRRAGHAGAGDDRPRQRVRRLRLLEEGQRRRGQADHRHRGLRRAGQPLRQDPRALGRRRRGRRQRRRRVHPHDDARDEHRGHAPAVPAQQPGQPRGLLLQAAHGQGAARRARPAGPRPHRHHRLPVGGDPDLPADGPVREGQAQRGGVPRHLRRAELLLRADGPRHRHRAPGPEGPHPAGQGDGDPVRRDERPALHGAGGREGARGAAVRAVRQDDGRPAAVQVRRPGLLPQEPGRDAVAVAGVPGGVRQHAAHRRALRDELHRGPRPHAARAGAGGLHRGHLPARAGARRAARALPGGRAGGPHQAGRLRGRRHRQDGLPRLLPRHGRPVQARQGRGHPRRARPRLGGRLAGRLRAEDHRPRPDPAQAAVRALPQPRAHLDAGHRPRLRRAPARRHDPLRHREVRRGARQPDHHVRDDQGEGRREGRGPRPRLPVRRRRQDHQGDAAGRHGQGHPAVGDLRPDAQALLRGGRVPRAVRERPRRQERRGHRARARGPQAAVGRARRRRHPVPRAAAGRHPDPPTRAGRRDHHPVRHGCLRDARPAQDGLPGPAQPHGPGRLPQAHRLQPRRDGRAGDAAAGGPAHLRAARQRRHPRRLPARQPRHARAAALDEAGQLRGHLRRPRAVPAGPDGRQRPQRLRRPQERPQAGRADPPPSSRSRWPTSWATPTG